MKKIKEGYSKTGTRLVTVELAADEVLVAFKRGGYYKLGHPVEDVMHADVLINGVPVSWCSVEQKWSI